MRIVDHLGEEILVGDMVWLRSAQYTEQMCRQVWDDPAPKFFVVAILPSRYRDEVHPILVEIRSAKNGRISFVWPEELYVDVSKGDLP